MDTRYRLLRIAAASSLLIILTSCGPRQNMTRLTVSPHLNYSNNLRIIALPFTVEGKPDLLLDEQSAAEVAGALMDRGAIVMDTKATMDKAFAMGLDMKKDVAPADLQNLAHAMNADGILVGTITYQLQPEVEWVDPIVTHTDTNSKGRPIGTSTTGGGSHHERGQYEATAMSARLISAKDFEILLNARVNRGRYTMSMEIGDAIRAK